MSQSVPLYVTEFELARLLLGAGHTEEWRALSQVLERHGLPRIDPQFGRRYFPAVKQYLDRRNRVAVPSGEREVLINYRSGMGKNMGKTDDGSKS